RAGESGIDFVTRQSALHDIAWVVAPETGGLLAQMHKAVGPARWLGCDLPAIELASAKRATLMRLAAHGLATPLAFEHEPEVLHWVVKPDDGAGGVDTRLHSSQESALDDWAQRSRAGSPMAVEPWVEGEALSLSLLCGARHIEMLSVNHQHIAIDAEGALSFEGVDVNTLAANSERGQVLARLANQVAAAIPGLRGFVGIDLVWHPQRGPVVIEVNPRVTCAYVGLSVSLGRNLAAELVEDHA
ncbi:MAG TPA: ATP-grasp domain-containing protein, partial [Rhizobacter sp.]|nr:ATP-grasp domain-containing protein [Rhizobacter sp.]